MSVQQNPETTIDPVYILPNEIFEVIFSDLPITTLFICRRVSKSWKHIVEDDGIWRSKFHQIYWEYHNDDGETDSWYELYKERHILESNWKNGKFRQYKLSGHSDDTLCVKSFKNWIITGSKDCTIRIWDNETFECLRVLGEPNLDILKQLGILNLQLLRELLSELEVYEIIKGIKIRFHMDEINCLDINKKYLASGSWDGTCIIWKLPDFEPIDRFVTPQKRF